VTPTDAQFLSRNAQRLIVEFKQAVNSPPIFDTDWDVAWGAKVDRIEINAGPRPSVATFWFPAERWNADVSFNQGAMVRIRTDEQSVSDRTVVFCGFVTKLRSNFFGGTEAQPSFERLAITALDHRWLLASTSPVFGQLTRGPDDYENYGTSEQSLITNSKTWLSGRRAIFNEAGLPNKDPVEVGLENEGSTICEIPIFTDTNKTDSTAAEYWTASDMLRYILCRYFNAAYNYIPIPDPAGLKGLDHADFNKVLNHIVIDGLNVIDAAAAVCNHLGWSFRLDFENDDSVNLVFYKLAAASARTRSDTSPTILHRLHAPAVNESVKDAVEAGKKMLWAMEFLEDSAAVINRPIGLGALHRFEFTAELVPGWLDSALVPDTSESNANLFFTEADLQALTDPNSKDYYKYYHVRGSVFKRNVGRRWSLNESGRYTNSDTYDRGLPFDFADIIPAEYILDDNGKRGYAPFKRVLLPCLTADEDSLNSLGIIVEFSFDAGVTWQSIPSAISSLADEAGIYIDEPNLAELVDQTEGDISGGTLDGVQLNFWTSLCDDIANSRIFKDKDSEEEEAKPWNTRLRVTASIQLDRRLLTRSSTAGPNESGSPFDLSQLYDFSKAYGLAKRTTSSSFSDTSLPVNQADDTAKFLTHIEAVRRANQDQSVSGQFTLDRLWLGDGSGEPDLAVGDCIEKITGRNYSLAATLNSGDVYPEIIQIIYLPDKQKQKLITRDLRLAEVLL